MAQKSDTTFYSMLTSGSVTGFQKSWNAGINRHDFIFKYNDRGRGPDVQGSVTLNDGGAVIEFKNKGLDYYKNHYLENMSVSGDSSVWTINDVKHAALTAGKFYMGGAQTGNMPPAMYEWLTKWLEKQPGRKGNLLPEGSMRVGQPVSKKISFRGKTATLKLYALYRDTIPAPSFIWLDDRGRFFAQVDSWFSVIKKGYETWTDTLNYIQVAQQTAFYSNEIKKYAENLPPSLSITHVNIFQSDSASVKTDQTVQVINGQVTAIYPSADSLKHPRGTTIDGRGKFLMPGLWDMHSHYFPEDGTWYLAGGVTHVRDMGNAKILLLYKKQIQQNQMLGPDISYLSGFIDQKGPFQGPTGSIVSSLPKALEAIREFHRLGYQQIKLYSSIDTAWVKPMAKEAHQLGMRVCGHIPAFMTAEQAINDGYDELTHMNFIFLDFMDRSLDTRTPVRFRAVADQGGNLDMQSSKVDSFINLMRTRNISFDPTMNVFADMINSFQGDTIGSYKHIAAWVPESEKSTVINSAPFGNAEQKPQYTKSYAAMLKMLKMMYDKGILIVPGTDGGDAVALHHELELYVQAGIPAAQALKMATWNTAKNCGLLDQYGMIKTGRTADFILIDGDPMKNISDIRRVSLVIKNNRVYSPKQLLASLGWKYYY